MPIPATMLPEELGNERQYTEWALMRCTGWYAMRLGGARHRERVDFKTPAEAVAYADEHGSRWLVYGTWDQNLRCELVPNNLKPAIRSGEWLPYILQENPPEGIWSDRDPQDHDLGDPAPHPLYIG